MIIATDPGSGNPSTQILLMGKGTLLLQCLSPLRFKSLAGQLDKMLHGGMGGGGGRLMDNQGE